MGAPLLLRRLARLIVLVSAVPHAQAGKRSPGRTLSEISEQAGLDKLLTENEALVLGHFEKPDATLDPRGRVLPQRVDPQLQDTLRQVAEDMDPEGRLAFAVSFSQQLNREQLRGTAAENTRSVVAIHTNYGGVPKVVHTELTDYTSLYKLIFTAYMPAVTPIPTYVNGGNAYTLPLFWECANPPSSAVPAGPRLRCPRAAVMVTTAPVGP